MENEQESGRIESNTDEIFSSFNIMEFSISPILYILTLFQNVPKKDFLKWLDEQQDMLLTYEQAYIKNEIIKFIESNNKNK
jgi:hypothetical protein